MSELSAGQLARHLCDHFSIDFTDDEVESIAASIAFSTRFLGQSGIDDLAPLLFLECQSEAASQPLSIELVKTIVSRVEKRLFRETRRAATGNPVTEDAPTASSDVSPHVLEHVVRQFVLYLKQNASLREALVFDLYYVRNLSPKDVCGSLAIKKTTFYDCTATLRNRFNDFLADIPL